MVEEKIKLKVQELEDKYNLNYYESLQRFMFERILERISVSEYTSNTSSLDNSPRYLQLLFLSIWFNILFP